jgi:hypothetical protein
VSGFEKINTQEIQQIHLTFLIPSQTASTYHQTRKLKAQPCVTDKKCHTSIYAGHNSVSVAYNCASQKTSILDYWPTVPREHRGASK